MPCDHPDLSDLEAATDCSAANRASRREREGSIGEDAMRSVLTSVLVIVLSASAANAAKVHHAKPRHVIERPVPNVDPRFPPVLQDQTPSYNDPSKFGSG
jgi:hypothetical protein